MAERDDPRTWWRDFVAEEPAKTAKVATVRKDGSPHVAPVWVALDGDDVVFTTSASSVKGRTIARDGRVSLCFDYELPPYHFLTVDGTARVDDDLDAVRRWATAIAARYVGAEVAEEYGRRNATPGEVVVRVTPTHIAGARALAE
ncbi:PPOX class F420-dependent oxidoreductase [Actinoalloteichus sp. AHMU CJ021]|uniref:PPOX class probable F420-dependent enzyme n=1 Tax=Actinoalloteichus caeruleus DSM 43889 TaxID=1120930 RepID=A0ABT1JNR2_ACTCY|nr:PPOX class F420-dependent oxidoreductase [Actinoalloteichus caeruleus]AUS79981.1 PPOX class F420-dependent oxidoreductase [Actinoalloteichus sp. AHMU CJ021]MCP2334164.1 PPOX class probable F420-dependent enzyme [Actinoalloteichus caeruleus DSM 43889]